ncbi:ribonuclease H-like domain-containing protein [Tanacetum coccineum]|uniref:Ribonuclease H-like domain-containing protein n=1 Tax=Tanacetum coccineum TaxID=301880 RepID=A0ABQ4WNS7_9ASTR
MTTRDPTWNMDIGASSHLNSNTSNLNIVYNKCLYPSVCVGDGKSIHVTNTGHSILPTLNRPLYLHNVLVTPNIIKNLISVRQFTRDNNCTVEFDAFGFSVKNFLTRHILLRCDSSGDLYPVTQPSTIPHALLSISHSTWHQRLGHPGKEVLRSLVSRQFISCNKENSHHICHACQLGKHVRLPFSSSDSVVTRCFEIVHSDIWTSPIVSSGDFKYPNTVHQPIRTHPMVTRAQVGTFKPNPRFHGYTSHISPLPKSPIVALSDSNWRDAMYKARLVANGRSEQYGVDFDDTFSLIAPRAWFQRFAGYALRVRFSSSRSDSSLFIYPHDFEVAYLLIYVDDVVLTASSTDLLQRFISSLHKEFDMTDLGALNYFLGISITRDSTGMFLSQKKNAMELLDRAHMASYNPTRTSVDTESKLGADGDPVSNHILYHSLAGSLQYLTFIRPDISYVVQQVCLYMHDPREPYFSALKYWAGCPITRRSTSGYCVFLGDNLLSWSSKQQHTLSRSSTEAEYRVVDNVVAETAWLHNLLRELHMPLSSATLVYCVNVSVIYLTDNPVQHQRTKHIEIDIHFVRDMVARGHVRVLHVPSCYQYADIFTKGLPSVLLVEFRSSLSVRSSPAPTAREC